MKPRTRANLAFLILCLYVMPAALLSRILLDVFAPYRERPLGVILALTLLLFAAILHRGRYWALRTLWTALKELHTEDTHARQ